MVHVTNEGSFHSILVYKDGMVLFYVLHEALGVRLKVSPTLPPECLTAANEHRTGTLKRPCGTKTVENVLFFFRLL